MTVTVNENGFIVGSQKREPFPKSQAPMQPLPYKSCPICGKTVREDRLTEHRKNAHVEEKTDLPSFIKAKQETVNSGGQTRKPLSQVNRPVPQVKKPLLTTSPGQLLIPCKYCDAPVAPKNMERHLRKVHPVESAAPQPVSSPNLAPKKPRAIRLPGTDARYVYCSECKRPVHRDKLQAHLRKVHDIWVKRDERNHFRRVTRRTKSQSPRASASERLSLQQLEQIANEPFDGGKHLGHIERENGRFGTLPLYDDYSEESTP